MKCQSITTILLLISFFTLKSADSSKILAIQFFGSKSHVITYVPLLDELAHRGHDVTLVGPSKGLPQEKSIKEIFTFDMEEFQSEDTDVFKIKAANSMLNPKTLFQEILPKICYGSYEKPEIMALLNETFDLIFIQSLMNDCVLGLVHKLNAPVVLFSPLSAPGFLVTKIGGHYPDSFVPNLMLGLSDEMTFMERMKNFGLNFFIQTVFSLYYEPKMEYIYRDILGQDLPSANEILANSSLILSNGHFSLSRPKPNLPNVIDVGGMHSRPAKPLPKDLEEFASKSGAEGFIVFSLGSIIKGSKMPEDKRQIFVNVFSKLKQQVIWKWESEEMENLPKNVKLVKWIPQQDLLGHKNVKMFITHCGMGGTEESIYHGVPLVGIPFFGDQDLNAKEAANHGFLVNLDWNLLTEQLLLDAINQILNNPKYRENVNRISRVFKDQPDEPLQRAVYWMEYVMRHKGAPHLKSASRNLNSIQYHSIDVFVVYLTIIFASLYLMFCVLKCIARKLCGTSKTTLVSDNFIKKKRN